MKLERSGPLSYGQLSVVRSLAGYGPTGQAVANLADHWELPQGTGLPEAVTAWQRLTEIHESLRTGFDLDVRPPRQDVHPYCAQPVPTVELPDDTTRSAQEAAATLAAEPIDFIAGTPWRAAIAVHEGVPLYLLIIIHHVAADNGGFEILKRQYRGLLTGEPAEAVAQPLDQAFEQQATPAVGALQHWVKAWPVLLPQDRRPVDSSRRRRASIYSAEALAAAESLAERLRISVQSVVFSAGSLALAAYLGRQEVTFGLMAANRLSDRWGELVSSLNQCAPVTLRIDPSVPPETFLRGSYIQCLSAYLNGCFDVDALTAALADAGIDESDPTFFGLHVNYLGAIDAELALGGGVFWRDSAQTAGPYFHLVVAVGRGLLIGVGASEDFLPGDAPAELATAIEAVLVRLAEGSAATLGEISIEPLGGWGNG